MDNLTLYNPNSFQEGDFVFPQDLEQNFLNLINRSNEYIPLIGSLQQALGSEIPPYPSNNDLNYPDTDYRRFDETTSNNPYGVGILWGKKVGPDRYIQELYSLTLDKLLVRETVDNGSTWTEKFQYFTSRLAVSIQQPFPVPTYVSPTSFQYVVGTASTRYNNATIPQPITLTPATYTVNLTTVGLNGLSSGSLTVGTTYYVYQVQERNSVNCGFIVHPTAGQTTLVLGAVTYEAIQTPFRFKPISDSGAKVLPFYVEVWSEARVKVAYNGAYNYSPANPTQWETNKNYIGTFNTASFVNFDVSAFVPSGVRQVEFAFACVTQATSIKFRTPATSEERTVGVFPFGTYSVPALLDAAQTIDFYAFLEGTGAFLQSYTYQP